MRATESMRQQMFTHIANWQQSDLTQKTYCVQNHIAYHIFHYWYKQYREQTTNGNTQHGANTQSSFVQLQVQPSSSVVIMELLLTDGKRLVFHQMVSSDYLKSLMS